MSLAHQVFNHTRVPPGEESVHTPHLLIKPVVGFIADGHHRPDATRSLADDIGQLTNTFVTGNILRVTDTAILPGLDHHLIYIDAGDAERAEEIALAAFVYAKAWQEQIRVQHRLIAEA